MCESVFSYHCISGGQYDVLQSTVLDLCEKTWVNSSSVSACPSTLDYLFILFFNQFKNIKFLSFITAEKGGSNQCTCFPDQVSWDEVWTSHSLFRCLQRRNQWRMFVVLLHNKVCAVWIYINWMIGICFQNWRFPPCFFVCNIFHKWFMWVSHSFFAQVKTEKTSWIKGKTSSRIYEFNHHNLQLLGFLTFEFCLIFSLFHWVFWLLLFRHPVFYCSLCFFAYDSWI